MSIPGLLVRFTVVYLLLLVVVALLLGLVGVRGNSGVNVSVLVGSVMGCCIWFADKNGRYFSESERPLVILGMTAVDVLMQLLLVFALAGPDAKQHAGALLGTVAFVGVLHLLTVWAIVVITGRKYAKRVAKGG